MIFERGRRWAGNVLMNPVEMNDWNVGYPCNQSGCKSILSHYLVCFGVMNRIGGEDLAGGDATKAYCLEDGMWK